jgi:hypothetical protein
MTRKVFEDFTLVACTIFLGVCCHNFAFAQQSPDQFIKPAPVNSDPEHIRTLIVQLDANTYRAREQATIELVNIGTPALQQLTEAMLNRNPEQTFRCARILESIGMAGNEETQLKIIRLFQLLSKSGFPQIAQESTDFRKQWSEKRRMHIVTQLRNAGVNVSNVSGISGVMFVDGGVAGVPEFRFVPQVEDPPAGANKMQLQLKDENDLAKDDAKSDPDVESGTESKSENEQPAISTSEQIVNILAATKEENEKALFNFEAGNEKAKKKELSVAEQKNRQMMQEVLEARIAADGGLRGDVFLPHSHAANGQYTSHQVIIDRNSDLVEAAKWLPQLEYISSITATEARITPEFVASIADRKELTSLRLTQCDFESETLHQLGRKRPEMVITVTGKALLGVYGPTSSVANDGDTPSAQITQVVEGSAAEEAGIEVGDFITAVDDTRIQTYRDLIFELAPHNAGDQVTITIERDGQAKTIKATLKPR